jgi:EamA domain-containing membrane protein RarD
VSEPRRGFFFGLAAFGIWGLFPLYWPLLAPAGAVEVLAHRIVWSLAVVAILIARCGCIARCWPSYGTVVVWVCLPSRPC